MNDYVLDASAVVLALVGNTNGGRRLRSRLPDIRAHAPHLIDAEVGNVLRRHEKSGRISKLEADTALRVGVILVKHRYPHSGAIAQRAWALRRNLTFYDALYVALAGYLGIPLLTGDSRLSRSPQLPCQAELI